MLTRREKEVSRGLKEAKPDKVMAEELGVSPATVNFHLRNLYRKLGIHSRAQFMARFVFRKVRPGLAARLFGRAGK